MYPFSLSGWLRANPRCGLGRIRTSAWPLALEGSVWVETQVDESTESQRDNEGQRRIPGVDVALGCPNGNRNAPCLSCLELLSCRAQQQLLLWFLLAELCGYAAHAAQRGVETSKPR